MTGRIEEKKKRILICDDDDICRMKLSSQLKKMGFDWATVQGAGTANPLSLQQFSVLSDGKAFLAMLEVLRKDKLVRVLAEPTLVTVSGRPANFHTGGEVRVAQAGGQEEFVEIGTRVDFVPLLIGPDRIRLDMKVAVTELLEARPTESGKQSPKVKRMVVDTGLEMEVGKTCVVSGLTRHADKSGDESAEAFETLLLVTPQVVERPLTTQAAYVE